jgi:hypothetical protein
MMNTATSVFLWLVLSLVTLQEHKTLQALKKEMALLVKEVEERKKQRQELLKQLIE